MLVKDAIADITLQQVLTRPDEFDVIATLNLNGDYLSDALRGAGGRHRHRAGRQHQLRHRPRASSRPPTAPRPSTPNLDKVNPGSVILSGEMMLRYMGWTEAADLHHRGAWKTHRAEDRDLRLRAAHGGREGSEVLRVRHRRSSRTMESL